MRAWFSSVVSVAVASVLVAPWTSAPAQAHARSAPPLVSSASQAARTVKVDIDGDGRKDTVRLLRLRSTSDTTTWKVTVTTRHKTASRSFSANRYLYGGPWYGTAKLDGDKGAEIIVNIDDYDVRVLHWRGGKLEFESIAQTQWSPLGVTRTSSTWPLAGDSTSYYDSYRFFSSGSKRYAESYFLECGDCEGSGLYGLYVVRSRWKAHGWHVERTSHRTVDSATAEKSYLGEFHGVKVTR